MLTDKGMDKQNVTYRHSAVFFSFKEKKRHWRTSQRVIPEDIMLSEMSDLEKGKHG